MNIIDACIEGRKRNRAFRPLGGNEKCRFIEDSDGALLFVSSIGEKHPVTAGSITSGNYAISDMYDWKGNPIGQEVTKENFQDYLGKTVKCDESTFPLCGIFEAYGVVSFLSKNKVSYPSATYYP